MNFRNTTTISILIVFLIFCVAVFIGMLAQYAKPDKWVYNQDPKFAFAYNLAKPALEFNLPKDLEEISGLSEYKENQVMAIQDEKGILYVYDLLKGNIVREYKFGKNQDYEGLAMANDTMYALKHDGDIFQISGWSTNNLLVKKIETFLNSSHETEGLCYDQKNYRLLVALKEQVDNDKAYQNKRAIFALDLSTLRLSPEPVFLIDEEEVGEIVYSKRKKYRFKPSAIAIHPLTGDIYVLASVGKILIVLSPEGKIRYIQLLNPSDFRQPEGIAFDYAKNRMIIASEAHGAVAKLKVFDPK